MNIRDPQTQYRDGIVTVTHLAEDLLRQLAAGDSEVTVDFHNLQIQGVGDPKESWTLNGKLTLHGGKPRRTTPPPLPLHRAQK